MDDKQAPGNPTGKTAERKQKKPFEPPRLHVYGDISALTRAVGQTGLADGGKGKTAKTRP
jgi:hypothetical protein